MGIAVDGRAEGLDGLSLVLNQTPQNAQKPDDHEQSAKQDDSDHDPGRHEPKRIGALTGVMANQIPEDVCPLQNESKDKQNHQGAGRHPANGGKQNRPRKGVMDD